MNGTGKSPLGNVSAFDEASHEDLRIDSILQRLENAIDQSQVLNTQLYNVRERLYGPFPVNPTENGLNQTSLGVLDRAIIKLDTLDDLFYSMRGHIEVLKQV
jgi:hypothetical protein